MSRGSAQAASKPGAHGREHRGDCFKDELGFFETAGLRHLRIDQHHLIGDHQVDEVREVATNGEYFPKLVGRWCDDLGSGWLALCSDMSIDQIQDRAAGSVNDGAERTRLRWPVTDVSHDVDCNPIVS